MSVTISMGLGAHADTYAQTAEYARVAIELALGGAGIRSSSKTGTRFPIMAVNPDGGENHACQGTGESTCTQRVYEPERQCGCDGP